MGVEKFFEMSVFCRIIKKARKDVKKVWSTTSSGAETELFILSYLYYISVEG